MYVLVWCVLCVQVRVSACCVLCVCAGRARTHACVCDTFVLRCASFYACAPSRVLVCVFVLWCVCITGMCVVHVCVILWDVCVRVCACTCDVHVCVILCDVCVRVCMHVLCGVCA